MFHRWMSGLHILPLAFVMIAGPQILTSIFLATTERWKVNSALFVSGAALSITIVTTFAYLFANVPAYSGSSGSRAIHVAIAVMLVIAMAHTFVTRARAATPSWMTRLEGASPRFAFVLGFLLLGVFPTDIFTSFSVGAYVAAQGDRWADILPFVMLTLLFLSLPALISIAFGARAQVWLPATRQWMNSHAWIVNEVVLGIFVALSVSNV
jgi:hypothetical protein